MADPGEGVNPKEGVLTYYLAYFYRKLMKMKEFGPRGVQNFTM